MNVLISENAFSSNSSSDGEKADKVKDKFSVKNSIDISKTSGSITLKKKLNNNFMKSEKI